MEELKQKTHQACLTKVQDRIDSLKEELANLKESAASDTKSSMGDKYETSREMINLEKGKLTGQLGEAIEMITILKSFDVDSKGVKIGLGNLVITNISKFYLSVAIGPLDLEGQKVFAISPGSPLGRQLLNKADGEEVQFGSATHKIEAFY